MAEFEWRSWLALDGAELMARDYPGPAEGTPVLCLHGLTRNSRDFEAVAPWIAAQGRRVLAADVRGRGRSAYAPDPAAYQPAVYAADVLAMLDALAVPRVVLVGTSMGGLIAMLLAVAAPDRLAAVALNDVGPVLDPTGLARIANRGGMLPEVRDWADAAAYARAVNGLAFPDYAEADWAAYARRLFREEGGRPVLDYDPRIMEPFRETAAQPAPDLWPYFDKLAEDGRPLLLVRGALSDLLSAETAAAMRVRAPQMAYAEVPRVGHAPMLTEPAAQSALAAFLATAG